MATSQLPYQRISRDRFTGKGADASAFIFPEASRVANRQLARQTIGGMNGLAEKVAACFPDNASDPFAKGRIKVQLENGIIDATKILGV